MDIKGVKRTNNTKSEEHNYNGVLPLLKKDIDENDSQARILKVMIKLDRPLRAFEISVASKMNRTRVHNNLSLMVSNGSILMKEIEFNKYYYPQEFFLHPEVMELLYEKLLPFVEIIHKNSDYSQIEESDNRKAIMVNIKMLLRMFEFEIDDIKKDYYGVKLSETKHGYINE